MNRYLLLRSGSGNGFRQDHGAGHLIPLAFTAECFHQCQRELQGTARTLAGDAVAINHHALIDPALVRQPGLETRMGGGSAAL